MPLFHLEHSIIILPLSHLGETKRYFYPLVINEDFLRNTENVALDNRRCSSGLLTGSELITAHDAACNTTNRLSGN